MTNFFCIVYFLIWTVEMLKRECPTDNLKRIYFATCDFHHLGKIPFTPSQATNTQPHLPFFPNHYILLKITVSVMNIACKIRRSLRIEKNINNKVTKYHFKKHIIPPKFFVLGGPSNCRRSNPIFLHV